MLEEAFIFPHLEFNSTKSARGESIYLLKASARETTEMVDLMDGHIKGYSSVPKQ